MRDNLEKFVAGYHGADSMRDKANRMFRDETRGVDMKVPMSASSKGRTNMRLYAEGGSVEKENMEKMKRGGHKKHSRHHKLSHDQSDLHIPKRARTPKLNVERFDEVSHMKRGGHKGMKRKCAEGGGMAERFPNLAKAGERARAIAPRLMERVDAFKQNHNFKSGGTTYEHQMLGESPSRKRPSINYEANMKGEHGVKGRGFAMGGVGKIRHKQADKHGHQINRKVVKGK